MGSAAGDARLGEGVVAPRSFFDQRLKLFVPLQRKLLHEVIQLEGGRLFSFQDGFDDFGREQGEAEDAAEVGFVDGFGFCEVPDGGVVAGLQRASDRRARSPSPACCRRACERVPRARRLSASRPVCGRLDGAS
jgi:hypothetical protein